MVRLLLEETPERNGHRGWAMPMVAEDPRHQRAPCVEDLNAAFPNEVIAMREAPDHWRRRVDRRPTTPEVIAQLGIEGVVWHLGAVYYAAALAERHDETPHRSPCGFHLTPHTVGLVATTPTQHGALICGRRLPLLVSEDEPQVLALLAELSSVVDELAVVEFHLVLFLPQRTLERPHVFFECSTLGFEPASLRRSGLRLMQKRRMLVLLLDQSVCRLLRAHHVLWGWPRRCRGARPNREPIELLPQFIDAGIQSAHLRVLGLVGHGEACELQLCLQAFRIQHPCLRRESFNLLVAIPQKTLHAL
mmetsp:Transcript_47024/g.131036  ORF Transcript_47024/g.131036 Transcript_47024/m.131036 type:complete len:305 (-) Transcript_47024:368-1282(-)